MAVTISVNTQIHSAQHMFRPQPTADEELHPTVPHPIPDKQNEEDLAGPRRRTDVGSNDKVPYPTEPSNLGPKAHDPWVLAFRDAQHLAVDVSASPST